MIKLPLTDKAETAAQANLKAGRFVAPREPSAIVKPKTGSPGGR